MLLRKSAYCENALPLRISFPNMEVIGGEDVLARTSQQIVAGFFLICEVAIAAQAGLSLLVHSKQVSKENVTLTPISLRCTPISPLNVPQIISNIHFTGATSSRVNVVDFITFLV